jgi:predicted lipoprotein with Yx(FWY)xxD motif
MRRLGTFALAALVLAALVVPPAVAVTTRDTPDAKRKPTPRILVTTFQDPTFGRVLAVKSGKERGKALYYWRQETRNGVECTGGCLVAWPPLIVPRGAVVPATIQGIKGRFGVTVRPDGRRQLTHNGRPLYSYVNERPGVVLCNDVNDWFVVSRI